mgnify:FL=1|nr:MAG TPA: hypothetical protein [Caudoviricetes sp.]
MDFKYIKWQGGVVGYLDDLEKEKCRMIDEYLCVIRDSGFDISVEISIEGGNQFHVLKNGKREIGYINANTCKDVLYGAYMAVKELGKAGC